MTSEGEIRAMVHALGSRPQHVRAAIALASASISDAVGTLQRGFTLSPEVLRLIASLASVEAILDDAISDIASP